MLTEKLSSSTEDLITSKLLGGVRRLGTQSFGHHRTPSTLVEMLRRRHIHNPEESVCARVFRIPWMITLSGLQKEKYIQD